MSKTELPHAEVTKLVEVIRKSDAGQAAGHEAREQLLRWRDDPSLFMSAETRLLVEKVVGPCP